MRFIPGNQIKGTSLCFSFEGYGVFCRVLDAVPALNSSDVIDFYGSCATDPQGKDEIQTQRIEAQHMFSSDYEE